jgi:hypothetical protein
MANRQNRLLKLLSGTDSSFIHIFSGDIFWLGLSKIYPVYSWGIFW